MTDLARTLTVRADGETLAGFRRARLTGRDGIGLYPMPFTLQLWNPAEEACSLLSAAREVSVSRGESVLASGTVSDLCRRTGPEGTVAELVFSAGLRLWEAPVSLSVEAGVPVSETVRRILAASGTGIALLSFPGRDPVRTRGQAFYGRAAECVESALSAAGARGCLAPSGLCVIPEGGLPVSMALDEKDLLDEPVRVGRNLLLLRTRPVGWLPGKTVSVKWKGGSAEGPVLERSVDADNMEGNWHSELLLEVKA